METTMIVDCHEGPDRSMLAAVAHTLAYAHRPECRRDDALATLTATLFEHLNRTTPPAALSPHPKRQHASNRRRGARASHTCA
jgi:hypothetical protein